MSEAALLRADFSGTSRGTHVEIPSQGQFATCNSTYHAQAVYFLPLSGRPLSTVGL